MGKNLFKKSIFAALAAVFAVSFVSNTNAQETTDVTLDVLAGNITIGSVGTFDFGDFSVPTSDFTTGADFSDYFFVEDFKGADAGYITTVQVTNLSGTQAGNFIPAANVEFRGNTLELMTGAANPRVEIANTLSTTFAALDTPITYIQRTNQANFGTIGKYGSVPTLQVTIPAYQAVDQYQGTLTYTLYEN